MAGSLPVLAMVRPVKMLMMVDFPTLGMPRIMACIGFALSFRCGNILWHSGVICFICSGFCVLSGRALTFWFFSKFSHHCLVMSGSARSVLLMIFRMGFWLPLVSLRAVMAGLLLLWGIRASRISMMRSMLGSFSFISFWALCMWPGYQWIVMFWQIVCLGS